MVREVVTIQLGSLSNYIGTHFWNAQESYFTYGDEERSAVDHDVHWRQGIGADGAETFLPRTIVYDFRTNFGSLRKTNLLYEVQDDEAMTSLWHGSPAVHKQPVIKQSRYQQSLDAGESPMRPSSSSVRYWTDFSRVYFHPQSLVQLSELQLNPEPAASFGAWEQGADLFKALDGEEEFLDNHVRPFVEECDLMQGFQMLASIDDGWGGFATSYLERVKDEYAKSCVWFWAPEGVPQGRMNKEQQRLQTLNKARWLSEAWTQASLLVPLALPSSKLPPGISLDPTSPWQASALLCTALETATLPYRLLPISGQPRATMDSLASSLNVSGKQTISSLLMGTGNDDVTTSGLEEGPVNIDFSGMGGDTGMTGAKAAHHVYSQSLTQRGAARSDAELDMVFDSLFREDDGRSPPPTSRWCSSVAFPILDSYPRIFQDGKEQDDASNTSVDALVRTDSNMSTTAKRMRERLLPFLGSDDRESLGNSLLEIYDEYHEGWSSGSDDDDD